MNRKEKKEQHRLKKERNNNIIAFNAGNDIKYRAPLGINYIRTLAWLCVVLMQISLITDVAKHLYGDGIVDSAVLEVMNFFASMSLPLFLLASFSYILQNKEKCGRIVLFYLAASMVVPLLFFLGFFHFGTGIIETVLKDTPENARQYLNSFAIGVLGDSLNCNIFIDMLLFSSLTFFLTAKPKLKIFSGKKLYIFRAFSIIPILYEAIAFAYKLLCLQGKAVPSLFVYALLPTKAPLTFIAFMLILAFEIVKKMRYMKLGGTEEGYAEFFATNKNSFMFAVSTAKTFAYIGAVDILLFAVCSFVLMSGKVDDINPLLKIGLGQSADLLTLAPFVLLFSYNRKPRIANYNLILPLAMIIIIVFVYLEGAYFFVTGRL